jgi:hypothetical protein
LRSSLLRIHAPRGHRENQQLYRSLVSRQDRSFSAAQALPAQGRQRDVGQVPSRKRRRPEAPSA